MLYSREIQTIGSFPPKKKTATQIFLEQTPPIDRLSQRIVETYVETYRNGGVGVADPLEVEKNMGIMNGSYMEGWTPTEDTWLRWDPNYYIVIFKGHEWKGMPQVGIGN